MVIHTSGLSRLIRTYTATQHLASLGVLSFCTNWSWIFLSFSGCLWHWCSPENLWASSNAARFTAANHTFAFMDDTQIDTTGVSTAKKIYFLLHSKVLFRMHAMWATTSFFMQSLCVQSRCCKGTEIANCLPFPHKKNNQHCSTCMYV